MSPIAVGRTLTVIVERSTEPPSTTVFRVAGEIEREDEVLARELRMATASIVSAIGERSSRVPGVFALGVAGLLGTGLTAWACARSRILVDPVGTAVWRSAFVACFVAVGAYSWYRRPRSRLGPLVAAVGLLYSVASLNASEVPLAYTLGMVVWVSVIVLLAYVFLCFPRGRLESRLERGFVLALVISTSVVWGLILALSPELPPGGSFSDCGTRCPPNALQIVSGHASTGTALNAAFNVLTTISLIGIAMLIFNKARSAGSLSRRTMSPLALVFIANIVEFVIFLFIGPAYPGTRQAFRIADGLVTLAAPLAILAGQLRGHAFATMRLGELAIRATAKPLSPEVVQEMIRDALGDPTLILALWDPEANVYVGADGAPAELPRDTEKRGMTRVTRDGWPVAVLIHQPGLETDSDIAQAIAATALMLLENWRLLAELHASRARLVETAEYERKKVERDLHDGAQQTLMAIQIQAAMARDAANPQELARQLNAIQREAATAFAELRELAHGIYPTELHDLGLPAALRSLVARASVPVRVSAKAVGRYSEEIEAAIYFCAREAIQNAAKHAGPGAAVAVTLVPLDGAIQLNVNDDGVGMPVEQATTGIGIMGMRDRVEAVGGRFEVVTAPGRGTSIRATVGSQKTRLAARTNR